MLGQIYEMVFENYHYVGKHNGGIYLDDYYGSGIAWCNVVRKYGKDRIIRNVICTYDDELSANILEKKYIKIAKEKYGENCLNIADGGQGGNLGPEVNAKISKAISGERNGMYGKKLSDETKLKISNKLKGHPNYNHSHWKPTEEMKEAQRRRVTGKNNPCKREEVKEKIRNAARNQKNRNGGVKGGHWYTDGVNSKCLRDGDTVPEGWHLGRTIKKQKDYEEVI